MTIKITKYFCFLLVVFSGLFVDCKKNPFDRRNKYIGTWKFTYTIQSWTYGMANPDQTGEYVGKIEYGGDNGHGLSIEYTQDTPMECTFSPSNYFSSKASINSCGGTGTFESRKNISFEYSPTQCSGAMGGGIKYIVTGTKQ